MNLKALFVGVGVTLPLAVYAQAQSSGPTFEWLVGILLSVIGSLIFIILAGFKAQLGRLEANLKAQQNDLTALTTKVSKEYHDVDDINALIIPIRDTLKEHGHMLQEIAITVAVLKKP